LASNKNSGGKNHSIAVSEKNKEKSGIWLFGDLMLEIDDSVGEVMAALKQSELTDNALVIFTSDNGPWLNNTEDPR